MLDQQDALARYLPPNSLELTMELIRQWKFQLRISRKRASKVGDYRSPSKGHSHRISLNHDLNPYAFLLTFIHEVAHLVVYEQHGRRASPHGKEWKKSYQELLEPFIVKKIFPADIVEALQEFFRNRGDTNRTDLEMNKVLRHYDTPNGTLTVGELPLKSLFKLSDGRLFVKGELIRKRYRCHCLNNQRIYLVNQLMEVYPVQHQFSLHFPE